MGYDSEIIYRRDKDAELIAWKKDQFKLIKRQDIIYEDLVKRYEKFGAKFKRGNVGLICLIMHIQTK